MKVNESSPKKWKVAVLTWSCLYPLLNICMAALFPYVGHLPQLIRTLILTLLLVPAVVYLMGLLQRKFYAWLRR